MTDTIVLGLDGANWALLEPWLEEGRLPNIQALRESGTYSELQSELPPATCPNWRCYSTGKNPGRLGVFWWEYIDTEDGTLTTPTSRSFQSADFWDYLNEDGKSVGVMNLPLTHPPSELDGFMVAGGPGSEQSEYTYPPELGDRLDEQGYRIHPETPVSSPDDREAAEELVELIDQRFETFRRLLEEEEPDVAHLTVFYVNVLQHLFYRAEPTPQAWEVIDEHIGDIREAYPDATLFLMSGHGCAPIDTVFHANAWLEEEGYLTTKRAPTGVLGLTRLAHRLGVHDLLVRLLPERVTDLLPGEAGTLEQVDWERSQAIASGQGLVYAIDDGVVGDLMYDLSQLESDHGPVATEVFSAIEAYDGPFVADAPDVVVDQREGVHTSGAIGDTPVFTDTGDWEAEGVRTGLFLADGPKVELAVPDREEFELGITDVAPTVLASVDSPVPMDVDGDPLQLFEGAPEFRKSIDDDAEEGAADAAAQDRLTDLGTHE